MSTSVVFRLWSALRFAFALRSALLGTAAVWNLLFGRAFAFAFDMVFLVPVVLEFRFELFLRAVLIALCLGS